MKKVRHIFFCTILLFFSFLAKSDAQVSVTAHVFAEIIPVLTAEETSQLNFGRFYPEVNGGSIRVKPDGTRSATGDISYLGTHSPASFTITGQVDATFSITLPTLPTVVTNLSNSRTMLITDWESAPTSGSATGVLTGGGSQVVKVGARLVVGTMNDNPVGMYSGTYSISFDYN